MKKTISLPAGLIAGTVLSVVCTGCLTTVSSQSRGYRGYREPQTQISVSYQDDYDYYPGYEVYYSRTRHDYIYLDDNRWVRRSQPRGISLDILLGAPSVRMDFHDAPEHHHGSVVNSYPRSWKQPGKANANNRGRQDNKKNDRKDDRRKDKDNKQSDDHRHN